MPPRRIPTNAVVNVDSSSEDEVEDGARNSNISGYSSATKPTAQSEITAAREGSGAVSSSCDSLESRSFWKAGNYDVGPAPKFTSTPDLLEHARVHPKFLHSNATSHKWAFGAIAELLDNAVDEIQNGATFVKVDKINIVKDNSPALLFQDDGGGMDPQGIRKCMSLGYSSKKSNTTIGQYGNGFKTSTMRLGADVIVFSRAVRAGKSTQSIGLLSYTYLRKTGQDDVIVPMIDFDISSRLAEPIIYSSEKDWSNNLNIILEWSPFESEEELMLQFEDIGSHGTKIVIFNLWLNDEGIYELSFDDDDEDIRLRDEANSGSMTKVHKKVAELRAHISYHLRYSLRAYASILYLRKFPNFKILLRGKPVEQYSIADDLKHSKVVSYKPHAAAALKEVSVETTIGFIKEAPSLGVSGFNVYHKNRLIRPYWKVTSDGTSKGYGVVGVLEANFIEPAHDKQDFERSSLYVRLEARLKHILAEYWKGHCHFMGHQTPGARNRSLHLLSSSQQSRQPKTVIVNGLSASSRQGSNRGFGALKYPMVSFEAATLVDTPEPMSVDQICDENIELFMRCESHKQKDAELKEKIRKVEMELEETRKKCAQLSSYLETKRKQESLKPRIGKV
ncbi:protein MICRORCHIDIA 2-like [Punica granatum]|uniref:Morc S5 domain-containing protein n=2 Tax=Punica granatum TaxID=22663 RepID=A0A218XW68_PUNGR|nr:protein MICRORCHIDIA 2-like [Punica granatum]OWM88849.1 hypothetical protein CDL15_Pgr020803 [Punica granatum]PKI54803.1 hypothetical protein CRG98_024817 [Punica granatum]